MSDGVRALFAAGDTSMKMKRVGPNAVASNPKGL